MNEPSALLVSLRTGGVLLLFTLIFTALMAVTYRATREEIAASVEDTKLRLIGSVLPQSEFDNRLLDDFVTVPAGPVLGLRAPGRAYRARKETEAVAVLLEAGAPDGYGGYIALVVAVRHDGRIAGARVTAHSETPGLGDYIDVRKDRNKARPWITQFNDVGFQDVAPARWKPKKDGGQFDSMAGATISARAVTQAIARCLAFVAEHGEQLYRAEAGSTL